MLICVDRPTDLIPKQTVVSGLVMELATLVVILRPNQVFIGRETKKRKFQNPVEIVLLCCDCFQIMIPID